MEEDKNIVPNSVTEDNDSIAEEDSWYAWRSKMYHDNRDMYMDMLNGHIDPTCIHRRMATFSNLLARRVHTVFILLGHQCNLNCAYCLQHGITEQQIANEINPDIYDFLENIQIENNGNTQFRFFGGEPLIFWKNIEEIVSNMNKRQIALRWSLMSNGKALTDDMVEFMNERCFAFAVSWDGPNVLQTRGYDVFQDKKKTVLNAEDLCISAVMSSKAYPIEILNGFDELDNEYMEIHNAHLKTNIDDIFNTGITPRYLLDMDWDRLQAEITELSAKYFEAKKMSGDYTEIISYPAFNYIDQIYNRVKNFYRNPVRREQIQSFATCCCGNGYDTYNLGLDGTLYVCHNSDFSAGNIYDSYIDYIINVIKHDTTKENMKTCRDCFALPYCNGGCKLVTAEERPKSYCIMRTKIYEAFIGELIKASDQIKE